LTVAKSKHDLQFSLRTLMVIITAACVILAFPAGYVLLSIGVVWMLLGTAIVRVLLIFRAPIYRFLSGVKMEEKEE